MSGGIVDGGGESDIETTSLLSARDSKIERLQQLDNLRTIRAARRYREDGVAWIQLRLKEHVWSKQAEILHSVAVNRRTAVPSCFASGKSWLAARLVAWWIDTHEPGSAFCVTTATTGSQVEAILWRELHRAHNSGKLKGRMNKREWYYPMPDGREEMVAFGRKPADMDSTAFQGIHARYVLVVLDEAAGIPKTLFDAAEGLIVNDDSRILAIGNPEQAVSPFREVCKPGSGWNTIQIPANATPNFTGEPVPEVLRYSLIGKTWVEEKRKSWTEANPLWKAKVLAEFPDSDEDSLIPVSWVRNAQARKLEPGFPVQLGVDVGGGGDKSVIACRRGPVVRIAKRSPTPNTMQTYRDVLQAITEYGADVAKVDMIGIGRGVVDRAVEEKHPVEGINVGEAAKNSEGFANMRAEAYWGLRMRFQEGDIDLPDDPDHEDLIAQLVGIKYKRTARGQIQIESKDDMKRRGVSSPDEADAVMLAFLHHERIPFEMLFTENPAEVESEIEKLERELGLKPDPTMRPDTINGELR